MFGNSFHKRLMQGKRIRVPGAGSLISPSSGEQPESPIHRVGDGSVWGWVCAPHKDMGSPAVHTCTCSEARSPQDSENCHRSLCHICISSALLFFDFFLFLIVIKYT